MHGSYNPRASEANRSIKPICPWPAALSDVRQPPNPTFLPTFHHRTMTTPDHTDQLANINSKILTEGETLPAVKLKDGSTVQTGTVAAMLRNIDLYNSGLRGQVEMELQLAIPTLFKVGLFDLFPPHEWVAGANAGRTYSAGSPESMSPRVRPDTSLQRTTFLRAEFLR